MKIFTECRRKLKNRKGVTLIEIIIAVAILGIIAAAFLMMFSNGLSTIYFAGNKSRATFSAQSDVDNKILNSSDVNTDTIYVDFYDIETPDSSVTPVTKSVTGEIIQGTAVVGGKNSVIVTFIP